MMEIINNSDVEKTKRIIKSSKNVVAIISQDDVYNRKMLEYGKFSSILNIESGKRKDSMRFMDSGFNEVLSSIAIKNNTSLAEDLSILRSLGKREKAIILARMMQNLILCRKAGVKYKLLNFKDKKDAASLLFSLGASSKQAISAF